MSSAPWYIRWILDDSDVQDKLVTNQAEIDAQAADWRAKRNQILLEMHGISQGIALTIRTIRTVAQATGQTLDPIQNALLGMISSTTSIIIATATAMAAGSLGLLTGAALVLAAFAYGFSIAQTAKVFADFEKFKGDFAAINMRLARMEGPRIHAGRAF